VGTVVARQPRPAVARIVVPEKAMVTSYGSGTLVDVRGQFGLVITNWHVVRDAAGTIEVLFPNGFRSAGRALKVDRNWDLAAIVIWRPNIEPVTLAPAAPRPGDLLTIAGYGRGDYREVQGRCTQYVAPGQNLPFEMVEIGCQARQGDSGGPIFNQAGQLAGVLFGAGQGTTTGSYCGRVGGFLASLGPDVARPHAQQVATQPVATQQVATQPVATQPVATQQVAAPPRIGATTPAAIRSPTAATDGQLAVSLQPPEAIGDRPGPPVALDRRSGRPAVTELVEQAPRPRPAPQPVIGVAEPLAAVPGQRAEADRSRTGNQLAAESIANSPAPLAGPLDQARNVLAVIGGLAVLFFLARLTVG